MDLQMSLDTTHDKNHCNQPQLSRPEFFSKADSDYLQYYLPEFFLHPLPFVLHEFKTLF